MHTYKKSKILKSTTHHLFTTRELVFLSLAAALLFVFNLILGEGVIALTGIPGASSFVTGLSSGIVLAFAALTVPRLGSMTIITGLYALLALPTNMAGGPPGYFPKLLIMIGSGLLMDVFIRIGDYRKWVFFPAGAVVHIASMQATLYFFEVFGIPGVEKFRSLFWVLTLVFIILGWIGMGIGFYLFERFKGMQAMKSIRG